MLIGTYFGRDLTSGSVRQGWVMMAGEWDVELAKTSCKSVTTLDSKLTYNLWSYTLINNYPKTQPITNFKPVKTPKSNLPSNQVNIQPANPISLSNNNTPSCTNSKARHCATNPLKRLQKNNDSIERNRREANKNWIRADDTLHRVRHRTHQWDWPLGVTIPLPQWLIPAHLTTNTATKSAIRSSSIAGLTFKRPRADKPQRTGIRLK